ncbi:hypothetical protein PRUPE_5G205900 [Prunus persica]|uniref:Ninja-family protein n=1 Tax=Prunus persica TaxID=3760 RepID=A0A251PBC2_PRUPE|nr:ninja-family protein AFP3 isoform X2 [Prunus persica]ONI08878.1 hypothetical protein PRUPE_5G205900 [Prunus persica]
MAEANKDQVSQPNNNAMQNNNADSVDPELNLGLSLGEIYTENPNENALARSSTMAGFLKPKTTPEEEMVAAPLPSVQLPRSSSVPEWTGQRMIRHKDILALRRMERKKRLAEKLRKEELAASLREKTSPPAAQASQPPEANATGPLSTVFKFELKAEGYITVSAASNGCFETFPSGSDIKPVVTSSKVATLEHVNPAHNAMENPSKAARFSNAVVPKEELTSKMPSVRTFGADGRKTEGVLYKYRQGQVGILCACHGSFLSPAEFVKHAGGNEVANPLRHIIICSTPCYD